MTPPIYVEIGPILSPSFTGIGRFVTRLIQSMARTSELVLYCSDSACGLRNIKAVRILSEHQEIPVNARNLPEDEPDLDVWRRRLLKLPSRSRQTQSFKKRTALFTFMRPPHKLFGRELCFLHDFTPFTVPWTHSKSTLNAFGSFCIDSLGKCDKFVADSFSTKADAIWLSPASHENVVVGYPGPSVCPYKHSFDGQVARKKNVILVVSTLEPRKNGPFLLDWFRNTTALSDDMELWWVGPKGWWASSNWSLKLNQQIREMKRSGRRVKFLGFVTDTHLCELYQQATFSVYPSLYEGFGFPVLDSLRHGTPVITSYNSSLKEFQGPGVHYFDPYDPASLDFAYHELTRDSLQRGGEKVCRPDLEERCSWDKLAQTVLGLCG